LINVVLVKVVYLHFCFKIWSIICNKCTPWSTI